MKAHPRRRVVALAVLATLAASFADGGEAVVLVASSSFRAAP